MKNAFSTKRALIASVLSIIICVAMLTGTTFAWFTDSVTSGTNQIIAGKLDVGLYTIDDSTGTQQFNEVKESTNLFAGIKWEPGYIYTKAFRIVNEGNLALKYELALNWANASAGKNGGTLADVIKVAVSDTAVADRDAAKALNFGGIDTVVAGWLAPEGNSDPSTKDITLVLYWEPTDNDDNFNFNNADAGKVCSIDLGIKLVATQYTYEKDGFNNDQYDADAEFVRPVDNATFSAALVDGGSIELIGDVAVVPQNPSASTGLVPALTVEKDTVIDLSGKVLGVELQTDALSYVPAIMEVKTGATVTFKGDGVLDSTCGDNNCYGIDVEGGTVIIENGTFLGSLTAVQVKTGALIIKGGFFDLGPNCKLVVPKSYAKYVINCIDANWKNGTATISITGGTFVNFDPSDDPEGAGSSYVADGYHVEFAKQANGDTWYTVVAD